MQGRESAWLKYLSAQPDSWQFNRTASSLANSSVGEASSAGIRSTVRPSGVQAVLTSRQCDKRGQLLGEERRGNVRLRCLRRASMGSHVAGAALISPLCEEARARAMSSVLTTSSDGSAAAKAANSSGVLLLSRRARSRLQATTTLRA